VSLWANRALAIAVGWFVYQAYLVTSHTPNHPVDERLPLAFLLLGVMGALMLGRETGRVNTSAFAAAVIGIVALDLMSTASAYYIDRKDAGRAVFYRQLAAHRDIAEFLRCQRSAARTGLDKEAVPYNFGDWYGIDTVNGYLPSLTSNSIASDWNSPAAKRMLGVEFHVGAKPPYPGVVEIFSSASGLRVYRDAEALPRAWIAREVIVDRDPATVGRWLWSSPGELRRAYVTAPVDVDAACSDREADRTELRSLRANSLEVAVRTSCRSLLVVSETFFPGWQARVDGRAAALHEVNSRLRGVVVPPGAHTVTMRYRPASVVQGLTISVASLAGVVAMLFWRRENQS
jgi:hypothetical protein